jgi:hypothetical protein
LHREFFMENMTQKLQGHMLCMSCIPELMFLISRSRVEPD